MGEEYNVVLMGSLASLLAGMCTSLGALGILLVRRLSARTEDVLLSTAAGIMLAATFFSLLLPGISFGEIETGSRALGVLLVSAGMLLGATALSLIHSHVPHEHFITGAEGPDAPTLSRIWLFVIAITLHNFPEGMAVGVGFAGGNIANGISIGTGIGLQNIPEGLAVAASLLVINYSPMRAFMVATLTGLVEPVGGFLGSVAVTVATPLMPWALGFAAGAMLFIISDEIIPETHRGNYKTLATFSLIGGFLVMMFLDATLG